VISDQRSVFGGRLDAVRTSRPGHLIAVLCVCVAGYGLAQSPPAQGAPTKEKVVTGQARGTFDVKLTPQAGEDGADASIARMAIDKQYHGDLEGTSRGQMLASRAKDSGGYVAMELVTGTLKGRKGSFVLQHSGTKTPAALQLSVTVVPDSATGQLSGLAGTMTIKVDAGKHSYEFDYTLPEVP
jgi:Protein of unknown function (DUF3224)